MTVIKRKSGNTYPKRRRRTLLDRKKHGNTSGKENGGTEITASKDIKDGEEEEQKKVEEGPFHAEKARLCRKIRFIFKIAFLHFLMIGHL